jgi:hypothetical protein
MASVTQLCNQAGACQTRSPIPLRQELLIVVLNTATNHKPVLDGAVK